MAKQIPEFEVNDIQKVIQRNRCNSVNHSTLLGMSLACALALVACDNTKNKEPKINDTEEKQGNEKPQSVELEPVIADGKKVCADTALVGSLRDAVKNTVVQQSKVFAAAHGQNANLSLDMNAVAKKSDKVLVDVKDIKVASTITSNGMVTCQASVSMTLPTTDISSATKMYAANSQDSLEQRVTNTNMKLNNNNMIVDDKFTFEVNPQSASPEAKIVGQPSMLQIAADVMATSALKSQIDSGIAKQGKSPVTPPTQSRSTQAAPTEPVKEKPQKTEAQKVAEQKAAQRRAEKRAAKKKADLAAKRAAEKKAARKAEAARKRKAEAARKRKLAAAEAAAEKKTSLGRSSTPNANADELAKSRAAKRAAEKRAQATANKPTKTVPVSSDSTSKNIEMVIVEEEDTY